jgi:hypothetical protein
MQQRRSRINFVPAHPSSCHYRQLGRTCMVEQLEEEKDIEGRTDWTKLPSVCIDPARASFRVDAIMSAQGHRQGRKVRGGAKTVLIHTLIYRTFTYPAQFPTRRKSFSIFYERQHQLRSESLRDLPQGPLHLMPPGRPFSSCPRASGNRQYRSEWS